MGVTKKICMGLGQQEEEKEKFCTFDEVVALVNKAIATPECSGTYHDYVELCKLYDKNENGTMMLAELENILSNLADEIPKETPWPFWLSWLTPRMRTACSPTSPSWT